LPADADGPALKGVMWYLCSEPPGEIDLGDIALPGVKDCPISGHKLPLVVVSRGAGGNFVGHHDIAETLADAGFVVAAINHPGHTTSDMSRSGDLSVFIERPTDIKRLIDFMLGASAAAPNIDLERIGFFGFSAGGDTGLILIGANPRLLPYANDRRRPLCASKSSEDSCGCSRSRMTRIKAAVIADPCCLWFTADSFAAVKIPVQLWASERATQLRGMPMPSAASVAAVDRNLPAEHEYHVVPNSGHVAFLFICPPALTKADPELCTDAPGFDRNRRFALPKSVPRGRSRRRQCRCKSQCSGSLPA
jgi:predicted dienelactone hydrolase